MKKIFIVLLSFIAFAPSAFAQTNTSGTLAGAAIAVVQTDNGKLRGYIHNGTYTYKGIPYAKAERFMAPVKPEPWQGVRTALSYGPICPIEQPTGEAINDVNEFAFQHRLWYMGENCQVLNVWTPQINDGKKRPVMVWLHGGGFTNGSSIEQEGYDGENLSRKGDVVIVSVNHRLNVLGFLDLSALGEKYKYSANAGLMDLQMALQWVNQNISRFGGDPANVTIFGQSGGGAKVTCLMGAPSAKGLFSKAIVQSGSYLSSYTPKAVSQLVGPAILQELGLQASQVDSLQHIAYDRLVAAGNRALRKVAASMKAQGKDAPDSWGPSINDFLPYQPNDAASKALSKNIPLMVGTTKNEFAPFNPSLRGLTMEQVTAQLQTKYGARYQTYINAVKKAYPKTTLPCEYVDIDARFRPGAIRQANLQSSIGGAPVYNYVFAWQSPVNDGVYEAMHCIEIPFVFNNVVLVSGMTGGGKDAIALGDKLSSVWLNFARTGNPNTVGLPTWPAYTQQNGATMIFDNQSVLRNHFDDELMKMLTGK